MDYDKDYINSNYGNGKVVNFKDLIKMKSTVQDTSEDIKEAQAEESFYNSEQERVYKEFKEGLCKTLQPIVQDLSDYLRAMEKSNAGSGKAEVEKMLDNKDINIPMYEVLMETISDLTKEYKVDLSTNKYFK